MVGHSRSVGRRSAWLASRLHGMDATTPIFQAGSPQAPEVADHGLLGKLEDNDEEEDHSSNIQRCTAGVAPSGIPLVTRCRLSRPE
jgi:hypothetical protein